MTDVDGPPVAPVRLSSLPIRGTDAAMAEGTDGSNLDVNCSMAQAFETSRRTGPRPGDVLRRSPPQEFPGTSPDRRFRQVRPVDGSVGRIWVGFGPAQAT